jgi:hypothetical protein
VDRPPVFIRCTPRSPYPHPCRSRLAGRRGCAVLSGSGRQQPFPARYILRNLYIDRASPLRRCSPSSHPLPWPLAPLPLCRPLPPLAPPPWPGSGEGGERPANDRSSQINPDKTGASSIMILATDLPQGRLPDARPAAA